MCVLDLYVHNQMFVVVILNEKGKIMNGKMSLLDPALQLSWPMKPGINTKKKSSLCGIVIVS